MSSVADPPRRRPATAARSAPQPAARARRASVIADAEATRADRARLRPLVASAWAQVLPLADQIGDEIAALLLQEDRSWYEAAGPRERAELRTVTRAHVRHGVNVLAGGSRSGDDPREIWRQNARRRARQGAPLELVLRGYATGARLLWEAMLHIVKDDPAIPPEVLIASGQWLWASLDVQTAVVVEAFHREAMRLQRRDLERQGRVIDELLDGRGSSPEVMAEAETELGVDASADFACIVGLFDDSLEPPLTNPEDLLYELGITSFWRVNGDTYLGLLVAPPEAIALLPEQLAPCIVGSAGVAAFSGLAGLPGAYQLALSTARTLPARSGRIALVTDRLPEVMMATTPAVSHLLTDEVLGPVVRLPAHQRTTLLDTLETMLQQDLSFARTAKAMFCHRNTVLYRVRRIEELTGRSINNARDRMLLGLAILAYRQVGADR